MTRRPNTKRRKLMLSAAFKLFKEKGYEHTTYQDVADAVGTTRTIVQSYFPKKTRFTEETYDEIFRLALAAVEANGIASESPNITLSRTCQIFLGFLLHDSSMRRFTKTTLSFRDGTAKNITSDIEWFMDYCGRFFENKELIGLGYTMSLGGTYEILYRNLCNGVATDVMSLTKYAAKTFIAVAGTPDMEQANDLEAIPSDKLEGCFSYMNKHLFKEG